jgi:16S rRNA processing protein RimM
MPGRSIFRDRRHTSSKHRSGRAFQGVNDRNQAETLNGIELYADRSARYRRKEKASFFMKIWSASPRAIKRSDDRQCDRRPEPWRRRHSGIEAGGRQGGAHSFTHAAVPDVDIAGGFIRIDVIAAGLVDDEDGDGEPDRGLPGQPAKFSAKSRPRGPTDAGGNR